MSVAIRPKGVKPETVASFYKNLQHRLGYVFGDAGLLKQALTPPSAGLARDNQRLEFLGDSILNLCAARLVYFSHTDWREGDLTKLRGRIVSTAALHSWAMDLGLVLETGPRSPKTRPPTQNELADAVEALLAAVALDAEGRGMDGLGKAQSMVEERFGATVKTATLGDWERGDPKTALQQRAAAMGLGLPVYELLDKSGPDHAPFFLCGVSLGELKANAGGATLKSAQSAAAGALMEMIVAERE